MRIFISHLPPTGQSAYFRARYPKSWWWTPDHDFWASILLALQGANWQRGGGKGDKPKAVKKPREDPKVQVKSVEELAERRKKLQEGRRRATE